MQQQSPLSKSFLRGQHDGQLLAEDFPGQTEAEMQREAELQLRLLSATGVCIQTPQDYIQGLFVGYQICSGAVTEQVTRAK